MNNIPAEVILNIFSMFMDVKDVLKFAKYNNYVFNIYKSNLDKIINKLINNNETNSFVNYVIIGCFDKTDSIDKKLNNIELIADFLSKNTNEILNNNYRILNHNNNSLLHNFDNYRIDINTRMIRYYNFRVIGNFPHKLAQEASSLYREDYIRFMNLIRLGYDISTSYRAAKFLDNEKINLMHQVAKRGIELDDVFNVARDISHDKIEKLFELIAKNIDVLNAILIINNFNEMQINKMEELIINGFEPDDAVCIVDRFDDNQIELIVQIVSINNSNILLDDIIEAGRDAIELSIIIKLLKNNFDIEEIGSIALNFNNFANFNDDYIIKCIELKSKGLDNKNIKDLLNSSMFENFDYEYYDVLIKKINDIDTVIRIICDENNDDDINKMVELINEGISKEFVFFLINYSKEKVLTIKPYLEYMISCLDIQRFMDKYDEIKDYIKMFKDNNLNDKIIVKYLIIYENFLPTLNVHFVSELIMAIKQLQQYQLDDDYINDFIRFYTFICKDIHFQKTYYFNEPPAKKPIINMDTIYELPQFNACIQLINKGFRNIQKLADIIKIIFKYNIDTKYIENLNDAAIEFVKTLSDKKLTVFFNLCKETNNIDKTIDLIKKLDENAINKICNVASNTGNSYSYSLKNYLEQSCNNIQNTNTNSHNTN
jgi:hypothetical protein